MELDDRQRIKRAIKGLCKYKELVGDILPLNMSICITKTCEWLQEQARGEYKVCAARGCSNTFQPYKQGRGQRFCSPKCKHREFKRRERHPSLTNSQT